MLETAIEPVSWTRFAFASVTVLGLLAFLTWALKMIIARGLITPRSTEKRLGFIATLPLDTRRRLVLTRCDDKEYLLLLSAGGDLLLSTFPYKPDLESPSSNEASHEKN